MNFYSVVFICSLFPCCSLCYCLCSCTAGPRDQGLVLWYLHIEVVLLLFCCHGLLFALAPLFVGPPHPTHSLSLSLSRFDLLSLVLKWVALMGWVLLGHLGHVAVIAVLSRDCVFWVWLHVHQDPYSNPTPNALLRKHGFPY